MPQIYLYNSLSRKKELFSPIDENHVRMYVCGPTVYDYAHIGNGRAVVVYDILFRLLRHVYGAKKILYARNITDVDDKINAAAKAQNISIQKLTEEVTGWFHSDMGNLNTLPPNIEPKATEHIAEMIDIIERLLASGNAYISQGHVLFDVTKCDTKDYNYGILSGRIQEEMLAGARIAVESYKKNPGDFVLWKPCDVEDDISSVFASPWGQGRPGWHIECSAMSSKYLGQDFDIHGGGGDLKFPHHENEIAQSCAAYPGSKYAKYWVHNGFVTVAGEKMSKSVGNFVTVRNLLERGIKGEVIRYAMLKTKYSEPLDWNDKLVEDAKKELDGFYRKVADCKQQAGEVACEFLEAICDDMNLPKAISIMHNLSGADLLAAANLIGILQDSSENWFKSGAASDEEEIKQLINARSEAKKSKNWAESDKIRNRLKDMGIILEDKPDGSVDWRRI